MSKKFILGLTIIMAIALVGITYIQAMWILNAAKIEEEQFDKSVKQALSKVAERLEKDEDFKLSQINQFSSPNINVPAKLRNENKYFKGKEKANSAKVQENYSIEFKINATASGYSLSQYFQDSLVTTFQGRTQLNITERTDPFSGAMNAIQRDWRRHQVKKQETQAKSLMQDDPIEERIDILRLEQYIFENLEKKRHSVAVRICGDKLEKQKGALHQAL